MKIPMNAYANVVMVSQIKKKEKCKSERLQETFIKIDKNETMHIIKSTIINNGIIEKLNFQLDLVLL